MTINTQISAKQRATQLIHAFDARQPLTPFSIEDPDFDLAEGYRTAAALRDLRGRAVAGRKIGFSNTAIWPLYGVSAPMWGWMYQDSVHLDGDPAVIDAADHPEPRIEPEILLHLAKAPRSDMDEAALLDCIDWIGTGFEIVTSPYAGWSFKLADAVAAGALHGGFVLGDLVATAAFDGWIEGLKSATLTLSCNGEEKATGRMNTVLGSPLLALKEILAVIEADPEAPLVEVGEVIATGTVTDAFPILAGQHWASRIEGLPLKGADVSVR
ncbi:MAG: hypothetical protein NXI16_02515 [Alphaproteobacteria bacterium]|nr:hypothetical protein [Alphaproteobacteria bacterium]